MDVRVFRFDFLAEKLSFVSSEYDHPCVFFQFLDFPPVLVEPDLKQNRDNGCSKNVRFNKGKSCYFESTYLELIQRVKSSPVLVTVVDMLVVDDVDGSPKAVGRGELDLVPLTGDNLPDTQSQNNFKLSLRSKVNITNSAGKLVATLVVKHQLAAVRENVGHKDTANDMQEHDTVPGRALECETNSRKQSAVTGEHFQLTEHSKLCRQSEDASAQADISTKVGNVSGSEEDDKSASQERVPLYLPNSVCPPPLFYQCPPALAPPRPKHEQAVDTPLSSYPLSNAQYFEQFDAASNSSMHWAVLMAHDQRNHPITEVKRNVPRAQQSPDQDRPQAQQDAKTSGLPLLTALLEELALLKSHMASVHQEPQVSPPVSKEPEKATKSLQTDFTPVPITSEENQAMFKPTSPSSTSNNRHHHFRGKRIVRECCALKPSNRLRVPKGKSVIYGPDITHKQRSKNQAASRRVKKEPCAWRTKQSSVQSTQKDYTSRKSPRRPRQNSAATPRDPRPKEFDHSVPVENVTPPGTEQLQLPVSSSGTRKLEVFIPQAVPEVATSLLSSGSVSSVETLKHQEEEPRMGQAVCLQQTDQVRDTTSSSSDSLPGVGSRVSELRTGESATPGSSPIANSPPLSPPHLNFAEFEPSAPRSPETTAPKPESVLFPTSRDVNIVVSGASTPSRSPAPAPLHPPSHVVSGRRLSVDLGSPVPLSKKRGSLLNMTGSQTLGLCMSIDSLDIAASTVLPKHHQVGGVYLAMSQSSFGGSDQNLPSDTRDNVPLPPANEDSRLAEMEAVVEELSMTPSQVDEDDDSLQYSDDFEQYESDTSTSDA